MDAIPTLNVKRLGKRILELLNARTNSSIEIHRLVDGSVRIVKTNDD